VAVKVTAVEIKDVEIPHTISVRWRARQRRNGSAAPRAIHAEREFEASQRLGDAAEIIGPSPAALQLRYLQTLTELGGSDNSTIVFPLPSDLVRPFLDVEQPRSDDGDGHETQDEAPRSVPRSGFAASAFEEPVARRARLHRDDDCRQDSVGKPSGRRRARGPGGVRDAGGHAPVPRRTQASRRRCVELVGARRSGVSAGVQAWVSTL
jgi:hypothetical protein